MHYIQLYWSRQNEKFLDKPYLIYWIIDMSSWRHAAVGGIPETSTATLNMVGGIPETSTATLNMVGGVPETSTATLNMVGCVPEIFTG